MALLHIDIDEAESTMTVDAWIRMIWKDEHLSWDKKEFNVSQLHFSDEELWRPDIQLYNKYDLFPNNASNTNIITQNMMT